MTTVKSVKFNFIMNIILTASTFIFPLITFPYISRILLPAGVGKVNLATSVSQYFSMVAMMGVPTYGIRACAQVRDDRNKLTQTVQEILLLNIMVSVFTYAVYFLAVWKVPKMHAEAPLYWVMSTTIIFNVIGVEWLYKGLEQYSYITIRSIVFKVIALVLMFLFVKNQGDYVIYGAISIVAGVGSNILNFINLRKYVDLRPVRHYQLKRHFKAVAIFFLMAVSTTIYTNLDTVMLGFMQDDVAVGYYSAAVQVKTLLVSFVTALSAVLLPRASYYIEHDQKEEFARVSRKALNFTVLIALPVVIYFIIYAKESIHLLSSEAFDGATLPMQIIMPTVLLIGLTNVLGIQILVPLGKEKLVFISVLVGAVVDFVVNLICIPGFSVAGAAFGTLIAEAAVLLVQLFMMRSQIKGLFSDICPFKVSIATGLAAVASSGIKLLGLGNFSSLLLSVCIFIVVYTICLFVMKEPLFRELFLDMIRKVLRRKI